ncbi:MAG TPA: GNAT family N-acetyltransferase [Blastocatellia bacterium]|nr:GNAT family N-acetyltransferase [Blastocatellia bacterium]
MEIKLSRCTLRPWRPGDEDSLIHHANNVKIWRNLRDIFPHPYTREDADRWIQLASQAEPLTNFAMEVNGEAAGAIGIVLGQDVHRRSAEIGYWLGELYWGKGIMTEAVRAVTDYAFTNFDLNRIWAGVFDRNDVSARVLENAGYKLEARLKHAVTKDSETLDELLYAIVLP